MLRSIAGFLVNSNMFQRVCWVGYFLHSDISRNRTPCPQYNAKIWGGESRTNKVRNEKSSKAPAVLQGLGSGVVRSVVSEVMKRPLQRLSVPYYRLCTNPELQVGVIGCPKL